MGVNKNAYIRYQTLDRCFRNPGRRYNIEDLLEECNKALAEFDIKTNGIQKRQLYDDIRFIQSEQGWSVPLEKYKVGRAVHYRYEDINFSINNQPLNETEASHLKSAMMVLNRFKGMPQFEWIEELIPKLNQTFSLSEKSQNVMSFETNEFLKGIEYLSELFNAIIYKKVLKISYHSFSSEKANDILFHPYHLKQFNKRWFLFGKNELYENLTNLALDRIEGIEEVDEKYIENTEIDFEEHFEDIIGVTIPEEKKILKIELFAKSNLAPYIKTKPLHGSQKEINEDEDGFTFSIEVIPNKELESLLLGFGENLKVLSPAPIQKKIIKRLKENMNNYD